jgi:hypothetical protein
MIIPAGSIIWHGTKILFRDEDALRAPAFAASIQNAAKYAFNSEHWPAEQGKIISFVTTRELVVLNMTATTLRKLKTMTDDAEVQTIMDYAFEVKSNGTVKRTSQGRTDKDFTRWLCSAVQGFDGWGTRSVRGFHAEVCLCKTDALNRYGVEIRTDESFETCAVEIQNAKVIAVHKMKDLVDPDLLRWRNGSLITPEDDFQYQVQQSDRDYLAAVKGLQIKC